MCYCQQLGGFCQNKSAGIVKMQASTDILAIAAIQTLSKISFSFILKGKSAGEKYFNPQSGKRFAMKKYFSQLSKF